MNIEIKLEPNNTSMRTPCFCCRSYERPYEVWPAVYSDGEHIGQICFLCIEAGDEAALDNMKKRAQSMRDCADALTLQAEEGLPPLPTTAEYVRAVQREVSAHGGMVDASYPYTKAA